MCGPHVASEILQKTVNLPVSWLNHLTNVQNTSKIKIKGFEFLNLNLNKYEMNMKKNTLRAHQLIKSGENFLFLLGLQQF